MFMVQKINCRPVEFERRRNEKWGFNKIMRIEIISKKCAFSLSNFPVKIYYCEM